MATQPTTRFWPLFTGRSDGKLTIKQNGREAISNGPNAQQLDRTPNAQGQCDYYRLIKEDEPKHLDWRKKLGGMLLRNSGTNEEKWQQCLLYQFPENYRLYEHIKSKADGQAKPVKNHSGGGHDRQDAYLYGHPKGPKKRFRSPVEFFPHLLWLSTDETGDPENCTCKLCCPVQLEAEKPSAPQQANRTPTVQVQNQNQRPNPSATPALTTVPSAPPPQVSHPQVPTPTPLPQPRSNEQQTDTSYDKFLARPGELTWFHRDGGAWGLGVIIRRWTPKDAQSTRAYIVQPLSYPFDTQAPAIIMDNDKSDPKLKPWLAWSAPNCTYPYLQQNPALTYQQVDWHAAISGRYGQGVGEVDASILAAKFVDGTYTLFERIKTAAAGKWEERHWNGIYLGAEKIWNGEPIRIHAGSGSDIMVITDIIERVSVRAPNTPALVSERTTVHVVGDIYTYAVLPAPDPSNPPSPPQNQCLPRRMREDMNWRNQHLVPASRSLAYWKLVTSQTRLDISEIKGRWYETSLVFPDPFQKAIQRGEGGNGIWMNSRGDCNGVPRVIHATRVDNRVDAFLSAVPKGTALVEGFEEPNQPAHASSHVVVGGDKQPPPTHEMQTLDLAHHAATDPAFELNDYMNLEDMATDDPVLPFGGQAYPF